MMNDKLQNDIKCYIKEISELLLCKNETKKIFVNELAVGIDEFVKENPETDIEEIKSVFGTAEEIAKSFSDTVSPAEIKKKLSIKNLIAAALICALLIWFAFAVISYIDVHFEARGYFEEGFVHLYNVINIKEAIL